MLKNLHSYWWQKAAQLEVERDNRAEEERDI
jgi:hypothetical protein